MFPVWEWDISLTHDGSFAEKSLRVCVEKNMRDDVVRPNVGTFDRKNLFLEFLVIFRMIFQLYELHRYIMFSWWKASRDHQWKVKTSFFKVTLLLRILSVPLPPDNFFRQKGFYIRKIKLLVAFTNRFPLNVNILPCSKWHLNDTNKIDFALAAHKNFTIAFLEKSCYYSSRIKRSDSWTRKQIRRL